MSHYYFLSYLLAEFIERQYGMDAIVRMLEGYAQGRSVNEMVGAVTGLYGPGLDGALERHIELRFESSITALSPLMDLSEISTDEAANPYEVTFKSAIAALRRTWLPLSRRTSRARNARSSSLAVRSFRSSRRAKATTA